jgi:hypothetical protein
MAIDTPSKCHTPEETGTFGSRARGRAWSDRRGAMRKPATEPSPNPTPSIDETRRRTNFDPALWSAPAGRQQCRLSIDNPFAMNANAPPPEVAFVRPAGFLVSPLAAALSAQLPGFAPGVARRAGAPGGVHQHAPRASNEGLGSEGGGTVEHMMKSAPRAARAFSPFWTEAPKACVKSPIP